MNESETALKNPRKGLASIAQYLFMVTGIYALACATEILFAERLS